MRAAHRIALKHRCTMRRNTYTHDFTLAHALSLFCTYSRASSPSLACPSHQPSSQERSLELTAGSMEKPAACSRCLGRCELLTPAELCCPTAGFHWGGFFICVALLSQSCSVTHLSWISPLLNCPGNPGHFLCARRGMRSANAWMDFVNLIVSSMHKATMRLPRLTPLYHRLL